MALFGGGIRTSFRTDDSLPTVDYGETRRKGQTFYFWRCSDCRRGNDCISLTDARSRAYQHADRQHSSREVVVTRV